MNNKYIDYNDFEKLFDDENVYEGETIFYDVDADYFNKDSSHKKIFEDHKIICKAPIGSGKSTALRKWMINSCNTSFDDVYGKRKYIVIVPTVNIAIEFYSKMILHMNNEDICVCVKEDAFKDFKKAIKERTAVIITTYFTACRCLGTIIEKMFHNKVDIGDSYTLVIDEAHLLIEYISLIQICTEFRNTILVTATPSDISGFKAFKDFVKIEPECTVNYDRQIMIHALNKNNDEQRSVIVDQVTNEINNFDKILIKVEDKNECRLLKKLIDAKLKSVLYNGETKEVTISEEGRFIDPADADVIIATSCIQAGQSIKENMLSIFIQTPLDNVTSVKQFIGRNRLAHSVIHLYLHLSGGKFTFKTANNRYKTRLNQLRASTWFTTSVKAWEKHLMSLGTVIPDEEALRVVYKKEKNKVESNIEIDSKELKKEFKTKSELYKYFCIKSFKYIPIGYAIKCRNGTINKVRTRLYKLTRSE